MVDKQAKLVPLEAVIEIESGQPRYVSRAGEKLHAALELFHIDVEGTVAMDVGASTGGFTDCLLQRGARRVYAVDVGYGLLDWRLRNDPRVVLLERTNVRHVTPSLFPQAIERAVIDVSFISLRLVLPAVVRVLAPTGILVALVKPQFEVGRGKVGKGGVVRDDTQRREVTRMIVEHAETLGLGLIGVIDSPIPGRKGNRELLVGLRRCAEG
jgi:23S rRNA (cytidine1920-2'-O)/16S rRNA (cytidine1409-2'-O)-methyltransferase